MFEPSGSWRTPRRLRRIVCGLVLATGALAAAPAWPVSTESANAPAPPPVVEITPPAPLALLETVPLSPGPGYVWIPGEWAWRRHRYVWIPGHYTVPLEPHHVWTPGHWAVAPGGGVVWMEGHWWLP